MADNYTVFKKQVEKASHYIKKYNTRGKLTNQEQVKFLSFDLKVRVMASQWVDEGLV